MELARRPTHMVLIRLLLAFLLLGTALAPAAAHKDHQKKVEEAARKAAEDAAASAPGNVVMHPMSPQVHEAVKDELAALEGEASLAPHERLLDWLGRIHPFSVHFPLALFPVSFVALVMARRRGSEVDLIRALIVVAGAAAAGAAVLGWLNAGTPAADKDALLVWHRWIGTALGVAGAGIALWSWRSVSAVNRRAMLWLLGSITLVLLVQGWIGGALIHGIDHLNW